MDSLTGNSPCCSCSSAAAPTVACSSSSSSSSSRSSSSRSFPLPLVALLPFLADVAHKDTLRTTESTCASRRTANPAARPPGPGAACTSTRLSPGKGFMVSRSAVVRLRIAVTGCRRKRGALAGERASALAKAPLTPRPSPPTAKPE